MTQRTVSGLRASAGNVRPVRVAYGDDVPAKPGIVEVRCFADWMKNGPTLTADLTPMEARRFAIEVLQAAERAEKDIA